LQVALGRTALRLDEEQRNRDALLIRLGQDQTKNSDAAA